MNNDKWVSTALLIIMFIPVLWELTTRADTPHQQEIAIEVVEEIVEPIKYDTTHIVRATTYNAEVAQCDSDPFGTADGSRIDPVKLKNKEIRWVALSRDLIWDEYRQNLYKHDFRGKYAFGDTITIYSEANPQINGEWIVHDCMNKRYRNSIDFLFDASNNKPKLGVGKDIKIITPKG